MSLWEMPLYPEALALWDTLFLATVVNLLSGSCKQQYTHGKRRPVKASVIVSMYIQTIWFGNLALTESVFRLPDFPHTPYQTDPGFSVCLPGSHPEGMTSPVAL